MIKTSYIYLLYIKYNALNRMKYIIYINHNNILYVSIYVVATDLIDCNSIIYIQFSSPSFFILLIDLPPLMLRTILCAIIYHAVYSLYFGNPYPNVYL